MTIALPAGPDKDAILAFIAGTIQKNIHLVSIVPDGPITGHWFGDDAQAAADWVSAANSRGANCHWTVNVCRPGVNKKPEKSDIVATRFLHLDIDPSKDGSAFDKEAIAQSLSDAPAAPTVVLGSGGGLQAFWQHDGGAEPSQIEALNRALEDRFGGDPVANIDRVMRLPGTVNWPDAKKRARGRVPALAQIIQPDTGEVYSVEALARAYPPIAAPAPAARGAVEIDWGGVLPITADDLGLGITDGLRVLINKPDGVDRSKDTLRFACEALRRGLSPEQIAGVLTCSANAVSAHCLDPDKDERATQRAALRAIQKAWVETAAMRSFIAPTADAEEDGEDSPPRSRWWTLDHMLQKCVFITEGSRVALIDRPRSALAWADFKNWTAASTMLVSAKGRGGSDRLVQSQVSDQWLKNPERKAVETLTFNPAGSTFTENPEGKPALNTWNGFPEHNPPSDWAERAQPFVKHVEWLFGPDAAAFQDWLAHLAQRPGKLPTFGFLHIAPAQGLGRGWISEVLEKVFGGRHVVKGFDLVGALKSGFNGELGGKLLAVVDEIDAGGAQWSIAQSLKKIVTETTRTVNAKYGRITQEHNACRWLIFSNSETALPLESSDRRFHVSRCDDPPKGAAYYERLYALRDDPRFVASVAEFLRRRDVSKFRPGETPPMTSAKRGLVERMRSDNESLLHDIVARWPTDLIAYCEIIDQIGHGAGVNGRSLAHDLDRAGLRKVGRIKHRGNATSVYAVRNSERWAGVSPSAARAEINRKSSEAKEAALHGGDRPPAGDGFFD